MFICNLLNKCSKNVQYLYFRSNLFIKINMSNEKLTLIIVAAIVIGHILFGIIWLIIKTNKKNN